MAACDIVLGQCGGLGALLIAVMCYAGGSAAAGEVAARCRAMVSMTARVSSRVVRLFKVYSLRKHERRGAAFFLNYDYE